METPAENTSLILVLGAPLILLVSRASILFSMLLFFSKGFRLTTVFHLDPENMFPQAIIPACRELFHEYLKDAHRNPGNCNPDVPVILGDIPDTDEWLDQLNNMKAANPAFGWDAPVPDEIPINDLKISEVSA